MKARIKALVVADSENITLVLKRELRAAGLSVSCSGAATIDVLKAKLGRTDWDVIIADFSTSGMCWGDVLGLAREQGNNAPVIFISDQVDAEVAAGMLKSGARDFLPRGVPGRLARAIERELGLDGNRRENRSGLGFRIVQDSPECMILLSESETIVLVNRAAERLFEYSMEEMLGRPLGIFIRGGGPKGAIRSDSTDTSPYQYEFTGILKSGQEVPMESSVSWITDAGKRYRVEIIHDLTDRRRAEESQRLGEERLGQAVRVAGLGIFDHNHVTDTIQWSSELREILGFEPDEIVGLPEWITHIHPDDRAEMVEAIKRAHDPFGDGIYSVEHRAVRHDGSIRWISIRSRTFFEGRAEAKHPVRTIGAVLDITERKQMNEMLRRRMEQLATINAMSRTVNASLSLEEVTTTVFQELSSVINPTMIFLFLREGQRLVLKDIFPESAKQLVARMPEHRVGYCMCGLAVSEGKPLYSLDLCSDPRCSCEDCRKLGVKSFVALPLNDGNDTFGVIGMASDRALDFERQAGFLETLAAQVSTSFVNAHLFEIAQRELTERKRVENELRQLNESLEEHIAQRTMEVRHKANQLRGLATELCQTEQRERQKLARVLHENIQQMLVAAKLRAGMLISPHSEENRETSAQLINDLIGQTLSDLRTLTVELCPPVLYSGGLGHALHWLARNFLEKHGFRVDVIFDPSGELADENVRVFMFSAIREALFNAVKHSGVMRARVEVCRNPDSRIQVTISDEGKGFDSLQLLTGESGSGLGLFSIQQRLQHLGGRLDINSAPGTGTRITLIAPQAPAIRQEPTVSPKQAPIEGSTERIPKPEKISVVLADDHHIVRQGMVSLLRSQPDIDVLGEASTGQQAIDLVRSLHPDIVLMDVSMPGTNGIDATREIHRDLPEIHIIGLSMHDEGEMSSAMIEAGAVDYVTKGGHPEALLAAIHKAREL